MSKSISYRSTILTCYNGNFSQAVVINLTPILFIPLREQFGLSYSQLGLLFLINFVTQLCCDVIFSGMLDKYGFRIFGIVAHSINVIGFAIFAASPLLFENPYVGFIIGTIVFSGGGGLLEILLSPIVNAIPTDEKAKAMSVMHSFYAWGQAVVVLLTTLMLFVFGRDAWQLIMIIWCIPTTVNIIAFTRVPMPSATPEKHQGMAALFRDRFFIIMIIAMIVSGASENGIVGWSSAFMERGMGIPKMMGDMLGMSTFAIMLGVGRLLHGVYGHKVDLARIMFIGCAIAIACYLIVAFSPFAAVSLVSCAVCGIAVSLLWPGTLSLAAESYPKAGSWIFAILAAGGDTGAALGGYVIGAVTDITQPLTATASAAASIGLSAEQLALRIGILSGAIFPIGALICLALIIKHNRRSKAGQPKSLPN